VRIRSHFCGVLNADDDGGGGGISAQAPNECPPGACCTCTGGSPCRVLDGISQPGTRPSIEVHWDVSHTFSSTWTFENGADWCWSHYWYCKLSGSSCNVGSCVDGICPPAVGDEGSGHAAPKRSYDAMSRDIDAALARVLLPAVTLALRNAASAAIGPRDEYLVYLAAASAATGEKMVEGDYIQPRSDVKDVKQLPMPIQEMVVAALR
jgi:hypothetical protein